MLLTGACNLHFDWITAHLYSFNKSLQQLQSEFVIHMKVAHSTSETNYPVVTLKLHLMKQRAVPFPDSSWTSPVSSGPFPHSFRYHMWPGNTLVMWDVQPHRIFCRLSSTSLTDQQKFVKKRKKKGQVARYNQHHRTSSSSSSLKAAGTIEGDVSSF